MIKPKFCKILLQIQTFSFQSHYIYPAIPYISISYPEKRIPRVITQSEPTDNSLPRFRSTNHPSRRSKSQIHAECIIPRAADPARCRITASMHAYQQQQHQQRYPRTRHTSTAPSLARPTSAHRALAWLIRDARANIASRPGSAQSGNTTGAMTFMSP